LPRPHWMRISKSEKPMIVRLPLSLMPVGNVIGNVKH
jgi:hypothetical protein